jgi:hypothetical protein
MSRGKTPFMVSETRDYFEKHTFTDCKPTCAFLAFLQTLHHFVQMHYKMDGRMAGMLKGSKSGGDGNDD